MASFRIVHGVSSLLSCCALAHFGCSFKSSGGVESDGSGGAGAGSGVPADTGPDPACDDDFSPEDVRADAEETPIGWAAVDAMGLETTTGGVMGDVVLARTASELTAYADSEGPLIIAVCGLIDTGGNRVELRSDKTLIGVGTRPTLQGSIDIDEAQNIVIRDLYIRNADPDGIALRQAHHVWVDHVDISDSADGNLDVTDRSDYVTVSYVKFWYTSRDREHRFSNLIGSSDTRPEDQGTLRVTMHHNWWADNVRERMPRTRYGQIHVFNNFYSASGNNVCIRAGVEASLLVESNYFFGVSDPILYDPSGNVLERDNFYENTQGGIFTTDQAFEPPYEYELDPVREIPEIVMESAGPRR
jgi:pectate lyase